MSKLTKKDQELIAAAKYGLQDFEEKMESDDSMRRTEIRERLDRAAKKETISAMIQRYRGYDHDITQEGYITG